MWVALEEKGKYKYSYEFKGETCIKKYGIKENERGKRATEMQGTK